MLGIVPNSTVTRWADIGIRSTCMGSLASAPVGTVIVRFPSASRPLAEGSTGITSSNGAPAGTRTWRPSSPTRRNSTLSGNVTPSAVGVTSTLVSRRRPLKISSGRLESGLSERSIRVSVSRPLKNPGGMLVIDPPGLANSSSDASPASRLGGSALSPDPRLSSVSPDMPPKSPSATVVGLCPVRPISVMAASW